MVRTKHRYLVCACQCGPPETLSSSATTSDEHRGSRKRPRVAPDTRSIPRTEQPLPWTGRDLYVAIRGSVESHFGEYGAALVASALAVRYFDAATGTAIVRAPREHLRLVWAACTLLSTVRTAAESTSVPAQVTVAHVGGTIRSCRQHVVQTFRARWTQFVDEHTVEEHSERLRRELEQVAR